MFEAILIDYLLELLVDPNSIGLLQSREIVPNDSEIALIRVHSPLVFPLCFIPRLSGALRSLEILIVMIYLHPVVEVYNPLFYLLHQSFVIVKGPCYEHWIPYFQSVLIHLH